MDEIGKEFGLQSPYQCLGSFLGIIGQNLSVSKSNQSYVVIFQFFFIKIRYIP